MAKQKKEAVQAEAAKPKKRGPKPTGKKAIPKPRVKSENPLGRPKIPEETRNIILDNLRRGNTKKDSCLAARVHPSTYAEWIVKATEYRERGIDNEYTDFSEKVDEAMADARRFVQECWQKHIPNDWRAGMAYLERTDPENWVVKQKVDVTSNGQSVGAMIIPMKDDGDE
jgi:hypothetical protein